MKVCKCYSGTLDIDVSPLQTVYVAKKAIADVINHNVDEINLIFKGSLLKNENRLYEYGLVRMCIWYIGITEHSVIHLVVKQGSDLSPRNLLKNCDHFPQPSESAQAPTEASTESEYCGDSIVESILKHIFRNPAASNKEKRPVKQLEEIPYTMSSYPNLVKIAVESPLIQDILTDINLTRSLIMTNPTIVELMELNPDFYEYLMNDEKLGELVNIFSNPTSYDDFPRTRQVILQIVESRIGHQLQFTEEYVDCRENRIMM